MLGIVRVNLEEVGKKLDELVPCLVKGCQQGFAIAESRSDWLIDVEDVCKVEPGAGRVPPEDKIIICSTIPSDL